jgi:alcohol dehydrogenase class IV
MMVGDPHFDFASPGRIVFGWGALSRLPEYIAHLGPRPLVVSGGSIARVDPVLDLLTHSGFVPHLFQVNQEPSIELIQQGMLQARECSDWVLGFGGGSVIDAAKAIAIMALQSGEVLDYLEVIGAGKGFEKPGLPVVAISTTAGTGSEVTRNAVLSSKQHQVKVSMRHPSMLPTLAIVDPALTLSCPQAVTASTGLDALTQLIEPFLSCKANPMTDGFCRQGIPLAVKAIRQIFHNPLDKQARTDMAYASLLGGLALANAGLGAVHGIAGPFGGMFPNAPHGAVCAALIPAALEINERVLKKRYSDHVCHLRLKELTNMIVGTQDAIFDDALEWIQQTVHLLRIPRLRSYGLSKDSLPLLIEKSMQASSMKGNPVPLLREEIADIIQRAL